MLEAEAGVYLVVDGNSDIIYSGAGTACSPVFTLSLGSMQATFDLTITTAVLALMGIGAATFDITVPTINLGMRCDGNV